MSGNFILSLVLCLVVPFLFLLNKRYRAPEPRFFASESAFCRRTLTPLQSFSCTEPIVWLEAVNLVRPAGGNRKPEQPE